MTTTEQFFIIWASIRHRSRYRARIRRQMSAPLPADEAGETLVSFTITFQHAVRAGHVRYEIEAVSN